MGISDALRAVVGDVTGRAAKHGRARPLIAMPLFGVGAGGFDAIRGQTLRAQLDAAREAVTDAEVDVVIVCFRRSDFAAIQRQRISKEWDLPDDLRAHAQSLAKEIKAGRLVLFLGAGVSAAAGIGDFAGLVAELERRAKPAVATPDHADLPARVAALQAARSEDWINAQVVDLVKQERYSLTHGLLASLRVREAITTNFDQLYEMSCERPYEDTPLEVLPWVRGAERRPWLLKAHGDPLRSGSLVPGTPSFDSFEADRATSAGVVRAMLALSREVLFVGYSLSDKNILRLVTKPRAPTTSLVLSTPDSGRSSTSIRRRLSWIRIRPGWVFDRHQDRQFPRLRCGFRCCSITSCGWRRATSRPGCSMSDTRLCMAMTPRVRPRSG